MSGGNPNKLTQAQKAANAEDCRKAWPEISGLCERFVKNTEIHITLFFANGRRLELYPTTMSLQNTGKWLKRFKSIQALVQRVRDHSKLAPLEHRPKRLAPMYRPAHKEDDDDMDLIE